MNTLPTAKEWLSNHKELSVHDVASYDEGGYLGVDERALYTIMIEFAKLHVEAIKKELFTEEDMRKAIILERYPMYKCDFIPTFDEKQIINQIKQTKQ